MLTNALDKLLRPEATAYALTLTDLADAEQAGDEAEPQQAAS
jgi:hypothetical protein